MGSISTPSGSLLSDLYHYAHVNDVGIPYENFGKVQGRKRITSKEGTCDFFFHRSQVLPEIYQICSLVKFLTKGFRATDPPRGHCPKISNRHNSGPEVDIDNRSTAFFTVRRPLADGVKICRQGAPQVCDLEKVARPQNVQTPIYQKLVVKSLPNVALI